MKVAHTVIHHRHILLNGRTLGVVFPEKVVALPAMHVFKFLCANLSISVSGHDFLLGQVLTDKYSRHSFAFEMLQLPKSVDKNKVGGIDGLGRAVDHVGRRAASSKP